MKIVQNKLIPPKGFKAITIFGIVFARKELDEVSKNHEAIHIRQGNETLWIFFYLWVVNKAYSVPG